MDEKAPAREFGDRIAAGDGIAAGTPFDNIDAFLDETMAYGAGRRSAYVAA